jgi:tetratricopeptide (TPR) repeat protein
VGIVETAEDWYNKGLVDKVERRLEEAVQCYDKALEIDPKYVQAWYGKGDALYIMGRCGKVVVDLEEALVLAFLEEALQCFDKALKLDPQNEVAQERKQQTLKAIRNLK